MRVVLRWIQSLGFWGIVAGAAGTLKALAEPDWGLVGVGLAFAAVSYGWYRFWGMIVNKFKPKEEQCVSTK
jgi:hypothetical protein